MTAPTDAAQRSVTPAARRILVVDDEEEIRRLATRVLIHQGYRVDSAEDGEVAWATLQAARYDLLITDHDMPKVTGLELLRKLHRACMDVPVIIASGTMPRDELERSPWLQPASTLIKPYSVEHLLHAVGAVLRSPATRPEVAPPCFHV